MTTKEDTLWTQVESFLREYVWLPKHREPAALEALLGCIRSQSTWRYIDGLTEKYVGESWDPGAENAWREANEFALSSLYEAHDGPHTDDCPERESYVVTCSDGQRRHEGTFGSYGEAWRFAEHGHACLAEHDIVNEQYERTGQEDVGRVDDHVLPPGLDGRL